MPGSLEKLLRPRSLAVFGGREARRVVEQCERMGFGGAIWPVHPRHEQVAGHRCYRSVAQLPGVPDAAFIGVNRHRSVDIVGQLSAAGAGGAVCYASGFLEVAAQSSEGGDLQAALLQAAAQMPIFGPNCYGLINYLDGALLWPDQHGGRRLPAGATGVAIICQSSNIAISLTMQQRGLPIAYVLTAGNQAQVSVAEMVSGLLEDPRVSAIGLHIEGFGDLAGFEAMAAKARRRKIPIVVLKVGRTVQAQVATLSHTASVAGSDAGAGAFLRRLGIPRVASLPGLLECLKLLHVHGPLPGIEIAAMSCSGGEACLMADAVLGSRLQYRPLSEAGRENIKASVGALVSVTNPLDYHTFIWGDGEAMTRTFSAMLADEFDLCLLVMDFPRADICDDRDWWIPVESFANALQATGSRGAVVACLAENLSEVAARQLLEQGIVPLLGIPEAILAIEAAAQIHEAWREPVPAPVIGSHPAVGELVVLDEYQAKSLLAQHAIAVPGHSKAASVSAACRAASSLGYPVALKVLGIAHKTDAGAVRLGLGSAAAVRGAARELLPLGQGLLVEKMVEGAVVELLLGVHRDPLYGPVLSLGAGGVYTELLRDSVQLLLPVNEAQVRKALAQLCINTVLNGYRGQPPGDVEALVSGVLAVAQFCELYAAEIMELDINPYMVRARGGGALAADALITMSQAH